MEAAGGLGSWAFCSVHVEGEAEDIEGDVFGLADFQNARHIGGEFGARDGFAWCCDLQGEVACCDADGFGAEIQAHDALAGFQCGKGGLGEREQGGHDIGHCGGLSVFHQPVMTQTPEMPVGAIVDPLPLGTLPDLRVLQGHWLRMEPVSVAEHGADLFAAINGRDDGLWTYMPYGPFASEDEFLQWLAAKQAARDPWFYAYVNRATATACGMGAFMRADAPNGSIELGNIWFSPALQKSREATEAIFLMIRHAFDDLGVRRVEWKCDALNAPSRKAALRFGFSFEGIFRQHYIIKGRNRDTAWFSIIDKEWPVIGAGFEAWLQESNFDTVGQQIAKLRVS